MSNDGQNNRQDALPAGDGQEPLLFDAEARRRLKCAEIQDHLVEYLSHELGEARSILIREHLRKCADCTAALNDIQAAFDALQETKRLDLDLPTHLTDDTRARVMKVVRDPFDNWIDKYHRLVAVAVTVLVLALAILLLARIRVSLYPEDADMQVTIVRAAPGTGPANTPRGMPPK